MNKIKDAPLSAGVVHYNMEAYGENLISRKAASMLDFTP